MEYKSETKQCQNCKQDFIIEPDDFLFYEKIKVPPPTFCYLCRAERRLTYRNERKLFKVKDYFTGDTIFSLYPEFDNRKIVTSEEWHSDKWDAMDNGKDYNFPKSFFEQLFELERLVPTMSLRVFFMANSPYCANASGLKNCHLLFNSSASENSMYGNAVDFSKDSLDNSHVSHSERCYECFWLLNCYQCYFTIMSVDSNNLYFCRDCLGCNECLGCVNLRNSSYCIFNKQYKKEEYYKELEKFDLSRRSNIKKLIEESRKFWLNNPRKFNQGIKNLNSNGSYVTNSKNVKDSFLIREGENLRYCQYLQVPKNKDCYDTNNWGLNMELHYETCLCGENSYNMKFSLNCWPSCKNIEYSINLSNCSDCFGCVGLINKQYCILNKQFTKNGYLEMIEKIKKHMNEKPYVDRKGNIYKYGEFFPIEFSMYGYNNSVAMQLFSMTKEEAKDNCYPWIEIPHGEYKITRKAEEMPDAIDDVDEDILKEVIECEKCKNAYRILENELIFYKKENLPLPTLCHECRFQQRIKDRLGLKLYERKCMCGGAKDETGKYTNTVKHDHGENTCDKKFKTGYNPEDSEIIYCENCYNKEVY